MSELTKMLAAAGLMAGGFFSATLFGVPQPTIGDATPHENAWSPQRLEPIEAGLPLSSATFPGDSATFSGDSAPDWEPGVTPASHTGAAASDTPRVNPAQFEQPPQAAARWQSPPRQMTLLPTIHNTSPQPSAPRDADHFASLAPPPLLSTSLPPATNQPPDRFPEASPLPAMAPLPGNNLAGNNLTGSNSSSNNAWAERRNENPDTPTAWTQPEPRSTFGNLQSSVPPGFHHDPARWHVVSDGDSLAKLAARYLRDETRASEIYALNRNVLGSPDLLPIGVELRIPGRSAMPREVEVFDSFGTSSSQFREQRRMVPLPTLPASVRAAPRAHLQNPIPASFAGGG